MLEWCHIRPQRLATSATIILGDVEILRVILMKFLLHVKRFISQIHGTLTRNNISTLNQSIHLISDLSLRALGGVPLVLVDERLDHPLVTEGGKTRRLIVQLVHELLGAVRLQLQICDTFFIHKYFYFSYIDIRGCLSTYLTLNSQFNF